MNKDTTEKYNGDMDDKKTAIDVHMNLSGALRYVLKDDGTHVDYVVPDGRDWVTDRVRRCTKRTLKRWTERV